MNPIQRVGPRCPECGTQVPPGLALIWAPPSGFACENVSCGAIMRMSRSRSAALTTSALLAVSAGETQFEGWDFAKFIGLVAVILLVVSWFVVRPFAVMPESRR